MVPIQCIGIHVYVYYTWYSIHNQSITIDLLPIEHKVRQPKNYLYGF